MAWMSPADLADAPNIDVLDDRGPATKKTATEKLTENLPLEAQADHHSRSLAHLKSKRARLEKAIGTLDDVIDYLKTLAPGPIRDEKLTAVTLMRDTMAAKFAKIQAVIAEKGSKLFGLYGLGGGAFGSQRIPPSVIRGMGSFRRTGVRGLGVSASAATDSGYNDYSAASVANWLAANWKFDHYAADGVGVNAAGIDYTGQPHAGVRGASATPAGSASDDGGLFGKGGLFDRLATTATTPGGQDLITKVTLASTKQGRNLLAAGGQAPEAPRAGGGSAGMGWVGPLVLVGVAVGGAVLLSRSMEKS